MFFIVQIRVVLWIAAAAADVVLVVTFCVLELFLYHAYVMLTDVHVLRFYQQPKLAAVFCAICEALGQVDAASVPNANGIQFMN